MTKRFVFSAAALFLVALAVLAPVHFVSGQSSGGNRGVSPNPTFTTVNVANGSVGSPSYNFVSQGTGLFWDVANLGIGFVANNGTEAADLSGTGGFTSFYLASNYTVGFANTNNAANGGLDTFMSRSAPGVLAVGAAGGAGTTTGKVKAAGYMSVGTTFTSNAGCGDTTLTGGATAGKYTSVTAGTCTTVITMGNTATAPNGWSCSATDLTTAADSGNIHQTATTTTTASLNETTVAANDVIQFSCIGY